MTTTYNISLKFIDCPFSDETNQKFINLLNSFLKDPAILDEAISFEIDMNAGVATITRTGTDRLNAAYTLMYNDMEASATKAATTGGTGKTKVKGEVRVVKGQ